RDAVPVGEALMSPALARLLRDRSARLGLYLLGAVVLFALVGPLVIPHDPLASDFTLPRDLLARLASGARLSLGVASAATLMAVALGTFVGITAGLAEGGPAWLVDSA